MKMDTDIRQTDRQIAGQKRKTTFFVLLLANAREVKIEITCTYSVQIELFLVPEILFSCTLSLFPTFYSENYLLSLSSSIAVVAVEALSSNFLLFKNCFKTVEV